MRRSGDDGKRAGRDRLHAVLRGATMAFAVALGVIAVWLIVTTDTRKGATVGALLGFWAILLGAYGVFGTRRPVLLAQPGQSVDLRGRGELSRLDDTASRREYEYRLAEILRREVQACMGAELATLRADVAALRSDFVEKVGGQLRMERIETTRVIGSDIEALQHEVRQLMVSRQPEDVGSFSLGAAHPALVSAVPERPAFTAEPSPMPYVASARESPGDDRLSAEPAAPGPVSPGPAAPTPEPLPAEPLRPDPMAPRPFRPDLGAPLLRTAEPAQDADIFASMPRLRPFADVDVDQAEPGRANGTGAAGGPDSGRHANANGEVHVETARRSGVGRRRRSGDGDDDMLARILLREGVR